MRNSEHSLNYKLLKQWSSVLERIQHNLLSWHVSRIKSKLWIILLWRKIFLNVLSHVFHSPYSTSKKVVQFVNIYMLYIVYPSITFEKCTKLVILSYFILILINYFIFLSFFHFVFAGKSSISFWFHYIWLLWFKSGMHFICPFVN